MHVDVRNETSLHHFLTSVKINADITLLSDINFPVHLRAQQWAKYSLQQLTAKQESVSDVINIKLIWESLTTEDTNFHRHKLSFHSNLKLNGPQCWPQSQVFWAYFSNPAVFKAVPRFFSSQGCSDYENWLDFPCIVNKISGFQS